MANKLNLELQKTEVSIGGREFVLCEMSAAKQNEYYQLINQYAQTETAVQELRKVQNPTTAQIKKMESLVKKSEALNGDIWTMMLVPNDENRDRITAKWLEEHTNGRIGELVMQEQLRLNDFDATMGKLMAQALPKAESLGMVSGLPGSVTSAPLAESILSTP